MFDLIRWLRRTDRVPHRNTQPTKSARLTLETLESREVPSVVSDVPWLRAAAPPATPAALVAADNADDDGIEETGAPAVIKVGGASRTRFNSLEAPVKFIISHDSFSTAPGDVQVTLNNFAVPAESITVSGNKITLKNVLVEGRNDFSVTAYDKSGLPLYYQATLWAGSLNLTVKLVDENGKPIKGPAAVKAMLGDDQSVSATATTSAGKVTFHNLPDRTILFQGKAGHRSGLVGDTGSAGLVQLSLRKFLSAPHLSSGQAAGALLAADTSGAPLFGISLSTGGVQGETPISQSIQTQAGTTAVRVRYRFTTSEIPGGYFGTQFNDYFRVSLASAQGASVKDYATMNGLGLAAFDANGTTQWFEKTLKVNPKGDSLDLEAAVANVADGLYDSYLEISVEAVKAELSYKVSWDNKKGGLKVVWTAKSDIESDTQVGVYFGKGTTYDDILGSALYTFTVPGGTKAGASQTVQVPGDDLAETAPEGTTHLVVASSKDDAQAIQDVQYTFGPKADSSVVSQHTIDVIKNALRAAGQATIQINSTIRRPEDQARAMFQNLVHAGDTPQQVAHRINQQKNGDGTFSGYGAAGDAVINVFAGLTQGQNGNTIIANQASIRQAMTDKIVELADQGKRVSRHCVTEEQYALNNIVDVTRSMFNATNRALFIAAANAQAGVVVLDEQSNNCVHLEVTQ